MSFPSSQPESLSSLAFGSGTSAQHSRTGVGVPGRPSRLQLDTNGLVHEAWMKMVDQYGASQEDRGHFFAVAASKRAGGDRPVTLEEDRIAIAEQAEDLLPR